MSESIPVCISFDKKILEWEDSPTGQLVAPHSADGDSQHRGSEMFASLVARAPLWAKPFIWLLVLPFRVFGWVLRELGRQAITGAKRVFAPLLWPCIGVLCLVVLYGTLGPEDFKSHPHAPLLTLVLIIFGFKVMLFGFKKPKKKK